MASAAASAGDASEAEPAPIEVKAVAWRKRVSKPSTALQRASSSQMGIGSGKNLKPSELKAMRAQQSRKPSEEGRGGAGDVLQQIAQMRAKLQVKTSQEKHLKEVLDEFLTTEANYLSDMRHTCEAFAVPLSKVCEPEVHGKIFANLQQLTELHAVLGKDIEAVSDIESLMKAFLKLLPFLKMYSIYCNAYAVAPVHLEQLRANNKRASDAIQAAQADGRPSLEALLFRPVQRMCVYPLLFREALKLAEEGSQLRGKLQQGFESVQATIMQVNEAVRLAAEQSHAADVLLSVEGGAEMLSATRKLEDEMDVDMKLATGALSLLAPEWGMRRKYHWVLLSDTLMVCRPNTLMSGYKKKLVIGLDEIRVISAHDPVEGEAETVDVSDAPPPEPRETPAAPAEPEHAPPRHRRLSLNRLTAAFTGRHTDRDTDTEAPDSPRVSERESSRGERGHHRGGFGHSNRAPAENLSHSHDITHDKPETFRLRHGQVEYKCWAGGPSEREHAVAKIRALQRELETASAAAVRMSSRH